MVFPGRGGFGLVCFSLMETRGFPSFGVSPVPAVFCSLMGTNGFPLFSVPLAGSRFHGRVCTPGRLRRREAMLRGTPPTPSGRLTSLRRQRSKQERRPRFTGLLLKRCLIKRLPCAARIGRPAQNSPALRAQTAAPEGPARCCADQRFRRGFSETPRVSARACVIDEKSEKRKAVNSRVGWVSRVGRVSPQGVTRHSRGGDGDNRTHSLRTRTNSSMTPAASVKARCALKAPSEPLIRGATGGEVRRSCLSGRSPRVPCRPPVVSCARQSAAKQTTGSAGSPFLLTSLATQRSKPPAGRRRGSAKHRFAPPKPAGCANPAVESRPGQCDANQRNAVGLHQQLANNRLCKLSRRNANQRRAVGPHQRITKHSDRFSRTHPTDVGLRCANPTYTTSLHQLQASSRCSDSTLLPQPGAARALRRAAG